MFYLGITVVPEVHKGFATGRNVSVFGPRRWPKTLADNKITERPGTIGGPGHPRPLVGEMAVARELKYARVCR